MIMENKIETAETDMDIEVWDALPMEEKRRVFQTHLDAMVLAGELIADIGDDGQTRYWAPENYHGIVQ